MIKTSQYIVALFLVLLLSTVACISKENFEANKDSELKILADSSSQESKLKQGLHKTYYSNGIIKEELYYKNGKLNIIATPKKFILQDLKVNDIYDQ